MSQYQRILCFVDPQMRHSAGLQRAAAVARATGAALHLSLIDHSVPLSRLLAAEPRRTAPVLEQFLDQRRLWLAEEASALKADGVVVTTQVSWSAATLDEMLSQATEFAPDLVVKDSHYEPLLSRLFLKALDWRLLRECPAPLLLVGNLRHALPRRVLIAVDVAAPAAVNEQTVRAGLALAIQCQAEPHLAYAFEVVPPLAAGDLALDYFDVLLPRHREEFDALCQSFGVPAGQRHLLLGPPTGMLTELAASLNGDVLVIGIAERRAGGRPLLGSTAESLLARAPCDMLAVPAP